MMKWTKCAIRFLRISRPGVRVPSIAPENAVKSKDFMAFLFCKPWVHGFCTVFARSVFSMSDDVGRCIALQSVPFFASGEQCQAEFCLHFRVGILQQLQKSRHGDGGFACCGIYAEKRSPRSVASFLLPRTVWLRQRITAMSIALCFARMRTRRKLSLVKLPKIRP